MALWTDGDESQGLLLRDLIDLSFLSYGRDQLLESLNGPDEADINELGVGSRHLDQMDTHLLQTRVLRDDLLHVLVEVLSYERYVGSHGDYAIEE
jgi:hypothetical protein